jgi:ABC-2 type transport system permease protein
MPEGNIDMGSTMGSYFGLLFLIAAYTSIGIFTSTLSENQIVAFLLSVFLCFVFYYGFEGASTLNMFSKLDHLLSGSGIGFLNGFRFFYIFDSFIEKLSMDYHFKSMSRGVIDTRDVLYFVSVAFLFLSFTVFKLKSLKS